MKYKRKSDGRVRFISKDLQSKNYKYYDFGGIRKPTQGNVVEYEDKIITKEELESDWEPLEEKK